MRKRTQNFRMKGEVMIVYNKKMYCTWLGCLLLIIASTGWAGDHDSLTPLLIDLKGWTAEKAEGMSMEMAGMKTINATRTYKKDKKEVNAVLMVTGQAMLQGNMQTMNFESEDAKVSISDIDGFHVQVMFDKKQHSTAIVVMLAKSDKHGAMFSVSCEGLENDDAMKIAKTFDWKKMKKMIEPLL